MSALKPFFASAVSASVKPHSILPPWFEQKTDAPGLRKPLTAMIFFSFSDTQAFENSTGVPGSG